MMHSYLNTGEDLTAADDVVLALWQRLLVRILALAACAALALYSWQKVPWAEILPIKRVQISGVFAHLSPAELESKAAQAMRGGFMTVSVAAIKRELLQDEWISEVAVRRVWPDSLLIYVTEHEPVALWGSDGLISSEGALFSPPEDTFPPGLPFLNGPEGSERTVLERYEFLKAELGRLDMEVDVLALTERRAWQFSLADGPLVLLGRKNVDDRFKRFFNFAIPYQGDRLLQAESVDLRYTNGFAVKWAADTASAAPG